jgi:hypothetical protein
MVVALEISIASIAIVTSVVSWRTLKAIKHLDVGKAFWIPVLLSSLFFLTSSIITILGDFGLSFLPYSAEVVAVSRLLAMCFIASGVYVYSRKITKNLLQNLTLEEKAVEAEPVEEVEFITSVTERLDKKPMEIKFECKHEFGFLRTLPRESRIPEECFGCSQIIECKYASLKKAESGSEEIPGLEIVSDMKDSDVGSEEETVDNSA